MSVPDAVIEIHPADPQRRVVGQHACGDHGIGDDNFLVIQGFEGGEHDFHPCYRAFHLVNQDVMPHLERLGDNNLHPAGQVGDRFLQAQAQSDARRAQGGKGRAYFKAERREREQDGDETQGLFGHGTKEGDNAAVDVGAQERFA